MGARETSPRAVLAIASVASFLVYLDVTVVNIAFPDIEAEFGDASRAGLAWVLTAYNIVFAALLVPGGRIADRFGRRRVFLIGMAGFAAASAACAAAPSAEALIAARVAQAAAGALLVPASQGLVLDAFEVERRTTAMSLWVAAGAVAAALGPPLGGIVVEAGDWRWVFLLNLPIAATVIGFGAGRLAESCDERVGGRLPDPLGIGLGAAAVGLLVLAIVQGEEWGWVSAPVFASFAGALLLAPLFVARARGSTVPAIDLALFRSRVFSLANLASILIGAAFYGQLFAAVLFLSVVWGYGPIEAGLALAPAPVAAALTAGLIGRRASASALAPLAAFGAAAFALGALWLHLGLGAEPDYAAEILGPMILAGAGGGLAVALLSSAAAQALPAESFAVGGAVNSATRQIGAAVGIAVAIALIGAPAPLEAVDAFAEAWLGIAVFSAAALAVALRLHFGPGVPQARSQ